MKSFGRFSLSRLLLSSIAISALPLAAQSVSVNLGSNETNGSIDNASALPAGALPVPGTNWTNAPGNNGSASDLLDSVGNNSTMDISWSSNNTWRSGSTGGTATSLNGNLLKGYIDDSPAAVDVTGIPYLLFDLYTYNASGQNGGAENTDYTAHPVQVNGTWYTFADGDTTIQDAQWTAKGWTNDDTLTEGSHYLKMENLASNSLSITSRNNSLGGRGSIAGLQVENTYLGTLNFWDINDLTPGAGGAAPSGIWDASTTHWSTSADGDTSTAAWTPGNGAVFSAGSDATDPYTITISGTQTADALWFEDGTTTLTGDGLTLNGQAIVRTDADATINSAIGGTNGLLKVGAGTLSLGTRATYTGNTILNDGTLRLTGGGGGNGTIRGSIDINNGASLELATGDATGYNTNGAQLNEFNLNGGNLHIAVTNNQTLGNGVINLDGGTITGVAGSNIDFFRGSSAINSLASNTTSSISGTTLSIRQAGGLNIDVQDGDAANDLEISSLIQSKSGGEPLIKTGDGTLRLFGTGKTYNGDTNINGGRLLVNSTLRNTTGVNIAGGAIGEFGATNIFVANHGTPLADTRSINVDGGTFLMNGSFDARFGNVNLANEATWTSNRGLGGYDALMGETSAGAAVVNVTGTGTSLMNGSGGIHLNHVVSFNVADTTSSAASDLVVSMILANGGSFGGNGGVNKTGSGKMEISGSAIYAGATNITEGELSVTGALGVTDVTVSSNAILSGSGTIGGTVNFASAGKLDVTSGTLTVTGNVSFDDFGFDDVIGFDPYTAANGTYTLIEGSSIDFTNVENFGEGNALDLGSGRSAWFTDGSLAAVVIPEPSASLLALLSCSLLLRRKRSH